MKKIKAFAIKRPYVFGLLLIFVLILLSSLTFPIKFLFPENDLGSAWAGALGSLIISLVFLLIVWRFGWLKKSGFTTFGKAKFWMIVLAIAAYKIMVELLAFTGDLSFSVENPTLAGAILIEYFTRAVIEEIMIRALLFIAMLSAWGDSRKGRIKAVILSSMIFGLIHLFNLFTAPSIAVLMQALIVMLPGVLYAVLLLKTRSIYPGILLHWLTNAAVNIKILTMSDYQESVSMYLIFGAALLPLMVGCWFVLKEMPEPEAGEAIV